MRVHDMTVRFTPLPSGTVANAFVAQAAMVEWVENGREIDVLVATKYVNDTEGIAFTRKLCPVSVFGI